MGNFSISGKVVDNETRNGVEGLQSEVYEKGSRESGPLGSAITDNNGDYKIRLDEADFNKLIKNDQGNLLVKVFQNGKFIVSTDNAVDKVVAQDYGYIRMGEVGIDVSSVSGTVVSETVTTKQASTRSILQATYTPRKPRTRESRSKVSRGLEKGAFFSSLAPSEEELGELAEHYREELERGEANTIVKEKDLKTTEIISTAISETGRINVLRSAKQFAKLEVDTLCRVAQDLIGLRQTTLDTISKAYKTIIEEHTKALPPEKAALPTPKATVKNLMEWAIKNNLETKSAHKTLELGSSLSFNPQKIVLNNFKALAYHRINRLRDRVDEFKQSLTAEHIGYLHLERMGFTPAGIERGRLVYSVPLSPGEEVNIRQREWSRTSEEFERIVTDYLEEFSEEGVTEKTELAQSVNSQKQHSNAFNTAVSTSGEAWGFSITASVGYNASESASKSEQITRNHTRELTSKASSRSKQEHKISFRVASARETEDETVQRIKNPFPDRATRVDYYQLIRKWQVDLYRYGIRLTYDIAIPEPGSGLLSKIRRINEIRRDLETGFEGWMQTILSKELKIDDIDPKSYTGYAATFNAVVEGEPPLPPFGTENLQFYKTFDWSEDMGVKIPPVHRETYEAVEIPEDCEILATFYRIKKGVMEGGEHAMSFWLNVYPVGQSGEIYCKDSPDDLPADFFEGWRGARGKRAVHVEAFYLTYLQIEFRVTIKGREQAYREWQLRVWNSIMAAAQARYYENRQRLTGKLSRLEEELGAQDALSLRKKEREEVMKGVLRFLICPNDFEFFPDNIFQQEDIKEGSDIERVLYELNTGLVRNEGFREDLLAHGEMTKFLHHAIEWENMLYFLYPYFWTHPTRWEFKKYLDHPDPMHRAFLKAGSARVVLTIRPGFEDAFLAFINTGDMNNLPPSPDLGIGQEFRNYANTNYPGIPPANPVDNYRPLLYPKQRKAWENMQFIMKLLEEYREYDDPNQTTTWKTMKIIMDFLEKYRQEEGFYPQSLAELIQYYPNGTVPYKDAWGNGFGYNYPGEHSHFDLICYGADEQPGGENENADITSWEEQYPTTLDVLEEHFPNEIIPRKDPWGNDYVYTYPGTHGKYDLFSYGRNGEPGGEGEDADITSWAEASLIGQWFEYTPTSALDIALDEKIPSA